MSSAAPSLPIELADGLERLGIPKRTILHAEPLTGGVSSDIWQIDTAEDSYCVKRALPVLKTTAVGGPGRTICIRSPLARGRR